MASITAAAAHGADAPQPSAALRCSTELGMFSDPINVSLQCRGQLVSVCLEPSPIVEKNKIQPLQHNRRRVVVDVSAHDRREIPPDMRQPTEGKTLQRDAE